MSNFISHIILKKIILVTECFDELIHVMLRITYFHEFMLNHFFSIFQVMNQVLLKPYRWKCIIKQSKEEAFEIPNQLCIQWTKNMAFMTHTFPFQFLHNLGMPKSWAMTDVYGLDEPLLAMLPQPVVALMLLFPINEKVLILKKSVKFCFDAS